MNRDSVGARSLKIELQAALNPAGERRSGVSGGPSPLATRSCRSGSCPSPPPLLCSRRDVPQTLLKAGLENTNFVAQLNSAACRSADAVVRGNLRVLFYHFIGAGLQDNATLVASAFAVFRSARFSPVRMRLT
jgi:hypothetical protein